MKKILLLIVIVLCGQIVLAQSPYIHKVYDYVPAPGQFINEAPEYEAGDTKADVIRKVEEYIVGNQRSLVSLGAYGGYIVFGFDHPVVNVKGEYDFKIQGNAFVPNETSGEMTGGSSEPGIVLVAYDANGNGIPDDEWYELAGSEYDNATPGYEVHYYKPESNDNILWTDNEGNEGYVYRNTFHPQSYWPGWIGEEVLIFKGKRLADNYSVVESGGSNYYLQMPYDWGYADNQPNDSEGSDFNIEWAVDASGNPIDLPHIDFIKVYTAVNQSCGWLGESSTEIIGAVDLHPDASVAIESISDHSFAILSNPVRDMLVIYSADNCTVDIYTSQGKKVDTLHLIAGHNYIDAGGLQPGLYIIGGKGRRFIKL